MHVVGAGTRFLVQARRRFQVVVHHVRQAILEQVQGFFQAAAEVGHQHFDAGVRRQGARLLDALDEMAGAAIAQVIAVDGSDDDVVQAQLGDGFRQVGRLFLVQRVRAAMADVAERAAARALVAHDHEGGGALAKTFADIRAAGFLAHRHELVFAQDVLDFIETGRCRSGLDADPVRLFQALDLLDRDDLDRNARSLAGAFLLFARVVARERRGRCWKWSQKSWLQALDGHVGLFAQASAA